MFDLENLFSLLTLTGLEIVLGIDNIVVIAIIASTLPVNQRDRARVIGLTLAMVTRLLLLLSIAWIAGLTAPMFAVAGHAVSGRDLLMFGGGLFLIVKAVREMHEAVEEVGQPEGRRRRTVSPTPSPRSWCWTSCSRSIRSSRPWAWPASCG